MIEKIGVTDDPREVGYYSGIVVRASAVRLPFLLGLSYILDSQQSTFALMQAVTVLKTGIIAGTSHESFELAPLTRMAQTNSGESRSSWSVSWA